MYIYIGPSTILPASPPAQAKRWGQGTGAQGKGSNKGPTEGSIKGPMEGHNKGSGEGPARALGNGPATGL